MRININESGISFNRNDGSNNAVLDESILKEIEERLKNINDKVEYSDKIPTDEDIVIWINPEEDLSEEYLIRINDETVASNTVWSSEKVNNVINEIFIQADSHIHLNKDVLDKITASDIDKWNNKSDFNGSYRSLTDKPHIPSIEGLASEEYVDKAIENLQLPSNLATIEDIPTKVSELTNDNGYITDIELEEELDSKGYLTEHQDLSHLALKEELFNKDYNSLINKPHIPSIEGLASEEYVDSAIENIPKIDLSEYATKEELHEHNNKNILDSITEEKINSWNNKSNFDGDYNNLINKPNIPTHTSELENDSNFISEIPNEYITETELENKGYLTEHQDLGHLALKEELFNKDYNDLKNKPNIPSIEGLASEEYVNEEIKKIDVTSQLVDYAKKTELHLHNNKTILDGITNEKITEWNNKSMFDGNYNSLINKPNIPTHTSNLINDNGFISEIPSEYITEIELENTINNIEKTVSSNVQPTDDNVTLWVNTSEDETTTVTRINDETVASNTTWSSEKVNTLISSLKLIKEGNVVKLMLGDTELSSINI